MRIGVNFALGISFFRVHSHIRNLSRMLDSILESLFPFFILLAYCAVAMSILFSMLGYFDGSFYALIETTFMIFSDKENHNSQNWVVQVIILIGQIIFTVALKQLNFYRDASHIKKKFCASH